jgi:hypothetical protein
LTVTAKLGATLNTLAPFYPDVQYLHPPGYPAIVAYLSEQMNQPIPMVMFALGAVLTVLATWGAYDLGSELGGKRLGRATALGLLVGVGLLRTYFGGDFTYLMGLAFGIPALAYQIRVARGGGRFDIVGGGLMMGATFIASFEMGVVMLLAYVALIIGSLLPLGERPNSRVWLSLIAGVLVAFFFGSGPWLVNNWTLITTVERFADGPTINNLGVLLGSNVILLPLAALGLWIAWQDTANGLRRIAAICVIWLLLIVDITVVGVIPALMPFLARVLNIEMVAQVGAIIPLMMLAGVGLLWLWERIPAAWRSMTRNRIYWLAGAGAVVIALAMVGSDTTWQTMHNLLGIDDVYGTQGEIDAGVWMYDNLPEDATILTAPAQVWVPVLAERDALSVLLYPNAADNPSALRERSAEALPYTVLTEADSLTDDAGGYSHALTGLAADNVDQLQAIEDRGSAELLYNEGMQVWALE